MERQDKIDVLVNEHEFTEESLDGMGDSCLDRTFEAFAGNDTDGDDDGADAANADDESTPDDDDTSGDDDVTADDSGADGTGDLDDEEDDTPGTDDGTDADTITMKEDELADLIDDRVSERVDEALAANQEEQEREALVDEITANSDEYDAEALAETPVDVLENIRDDVATPAPGANFAAQRGAAAQPATNDDSEDFPALSVNDAADGGDD